MTSLQLLFLNAPVVITLWLLLWFLSFALTVRLIDTENPLYIFCIQAVDRIRELYEMGIVAALAFLAASTFT